MSDPSEVIILTSLDSCPTGFSIYSAIDGEFFQIAASPDLVSTGSNTHTHASWDHTHTYSGTLPIDSQAYGAPTAGLTGDQHTHTSNILSGDPSANATIDTVDHSPLYSTLLLCKKD
jgi:hypothetical protein